MITKILGFMWLILGIIWVAKPKVLQNRIQKKMTRKLKKLVFGFVLILSFSIVGTIVKADTLLIKIIGIAVLVFVVKGIFLLTSKTSEKLIEKLQKSPIKLFRIWGAIFLVVGLVMLLV